MILKQAHIDELRLVYQQETGVVLTDSEAWEMATRMLRLLDQLTSPPQPAKGSQEAGSSRVSFD